MTEHLPECLVPDFDKGLWICICNQLRACEQRCDEKRQAEVRAWSELSRDNFDDGFAAGLDAAREAVVALPYDEPEDDPQSRDHEVEVRQRYLSVIDALKEKP